MALRGDEEPWRPTHPPSLRGRTMQSPSLSREEPQSGTPSHIASMARKAVRQGSPQPRPDIQRRAKTLRPVRPAAAAAVTNTHTNRGHSTKPERQSPSSRLSRPVAVPIVTRPVAIQRSATESSGHAAASSPPSGLPNSVSPAVGRRQGLAERVRVGVHRVTLELKLPPQRRADCFYGFNVDRSDDPGHPVVVQSVEVGSVAEAHGLRPGDQLVSINGTPVTQSMVSALFPDAGSQDTVIVVRRDTPIYSRRGGRRQPARAPSPSQAVAQPARHTSGSPTTTITFPEFDDDIQVRVVTLHRGANGFGFSITYATDDQMVAVNAVDPCGPAAGGLLAGDRLVTVNEEEVIDSSTEVVTQLVLASPDTLVLGVVHTYKPQQPTPSPQVTADARPRRRPRREKRRIPRSRSDHTVRRAGSANSMPPSSHSAPSSPVVSDTASTGTGRRKASVTLDPVASLVKMGFNKLKAKAAIDSCSGNLQAAVDLLLSQPSKPLTATAEEDTEEDPSSCSICWERSKNAACIPCGHRFCFVCCTHLKENKSECALCRTKLSGVLKTYD